MASNEITKQNQDQGMRFSTVHLNCLLRLKSKQQKNQDCAAVDLLLCIICVPMNGSVACGEIHVPYILRCHSPFFVVPSVLVGGSDPEQPRSALRQEREVQRSGAAV